MSTEQIIAAVQETVEVEPTEDDTEDPTLPPVSAKSALKAVETLRLFLLQQENCSTLVNGLDGYESQIQNIATNSLKQKKITSFFTTNGHFVCLLLVCLIPSTRKEPRQTQTGEDAWKKETMFPMPPEGHKDRHWQASRDCIWMPNLQHPLV
ncbi:hypothetical protein RRG08_034027 [Elysia crispata]|uniref:Uncharacterized protein n=1 Tax=Elysia crispata TaxID=231223 RepID=A0AAE0XUB3_9GAST|nr:hypothetical protein RRG08_034027 [Elysia crispata]